MIQCGLVSVSFRNLSCEEIIKIAKQAGLGGIEWGGDVHVKPGDITRAEEVYQKTVSAELTVTSYGSYYRLGTYGDSYMDEWNRVLDSAIALHAPVIRIWAYNKPSKDVDEETYRRLVTEAKAIVKKSEEKGIFITFECHCNTLTDYYPTTLKLMRDIGNDYFKMYWQPNNDYDLEYNYECAKALEPYLSHVHVFYWPKPGIKEPLNNGKERWIRFLQILTAGGKSPWCLLEFMPDDMPEALPREADTLREIIKAI